jgi:medium-chain acyl-[acyl-carrier-protein] hydrolase
MRDSALQPTLAAPAEATETVRLLGFPCAGGSASSFAGWTAELPSTVELRPVRLPGRLDRLHEPPFTSMAPLVETLADELEPTLTSPFAMFGHSMGALVAYELARELRRRGARRPAGLFVASCGAPHLPRRAPPLRALPDDRFISELRRLDGIPEELARSDELLELVLPALRADIVLCEEYAWAPEPPLDVPISVFGGASDPRVLADDLTAWHDHTEAAFVQRTVAGNHFFPWRSGEALVNAMADDLRGWTAEGRLS